MRIVLLITIAFLLSTTAAVESNEQTGETAVSRVPRALILQPVMKVREEEDDGPFDWLANLFRGMTAPKRRVPTVPPMLGPIRVPGVKDEVYIKQLSSLANANSRVVVRVMSPQMPQISVPMAIPTPYYTYYQTPQFPISPTRQLPMQSSGFLPMSSPTPTAQWQRPHQSVQQYPYNGINHHQNGFHYQPPKYQNQQPWQASHQPYYQSPYYQNPYGTHDFDNSIQNSGRVSNYISEPVRNTNYPSADVNGDDQDIKNQTIISSEAYAEEDDNEAKQSELSKVTPELAASYKEIYRPDRMAPTSPTWRNSWARKQKNTTASALGKSHEEEHVSKEKSKFSPTDMIQVAAPDLKGKNRREPEEKRSGLKVDEKAVEDEVIGKIETKEIEKRNFRPTIVTENPKVQGRVTRKRSQWTPLNVVPTQANSVSLQTKKTDDSIDSGSQSTERSENATPDVIQKVMSLTANNSWKNQDLPKGVRDYRRKNDSFKNRNRRVRIVESVRSSVSVTSSKGEKVKSISKS